MIDIIWAGMIIISLILSFFTNSVDETINAAFKGANEALKTVFGFAGAMAMWCGMIKIAEKSGLTDIFAKVIRPVTSFLFPHLKRRGAAVKAISMNMVANLLGLANAATPLGIAAMKELKKISKKDGDATDEMCMFVVLNTASIQLIPSTLIAIRSSMGSKDPSQIVVPIWIGSVLTAIFAVFLVKCFEKRRKL